MISDYNNLDFWVERTLDLSKKIESNINELENKDRIQVAENVLLLIRSFVEKSVISIFVKVSGDKRIFTNECDIKTASFAFTNKKTEFKFLNEFHEVLNKSPIGHDIISYSDYSVRLFIGYFSKLIKIKILLKRLLNIDVLTNINKYPLNLDDAFTAYYNKIQQEIKIIKKEANEKVTEYYYISSKRMIYLNDSIFYEYSILTVDDNSTKTDKMIAYSDIDIFDNYACELTIVTKTIIVGEISIDIDIIVKYDVRIRNCEFTKLLNILNIYPSGLNRTHEYFNLMDVIKRYRISVAEIVMSKKTYYKSIEKLVFYPNSYSYLHKLFDESRRIVKEKVYGYKTLLYLLESIENTQIKKQLPYLPYTEEDTLQNTELVLSKGVCPFETAPFSANLKGTITSFHTLLKVFDADKHKCEILKREIDERAKNDGVIFNEITSFGKKEKILEYISEYNKLVKSTESLSIGYLNSNGKDYIFSKQNVKDTKDIFSYLSKYVGLSNIDQFDLYVSNKMKSLNITFDDSKKENALKEMFKNKSMFAVYGPAGTGKSYFINKVVNLLDNFSILCLTTTYAARSNLVKIIQSKKPKFQVIEKVIKDTKESYKKYDFVIIDECSTISNFDMARLLKKIEPKLLLLVGDTYQIESIGLGNWFSLFRKVFKNEYFVDLDHCFRTNNTSLSDFWKIVRNRETRMKPFMLNHRISHPLQEATNILNYNSSSDSVILCLNYSGLLGINNVNRIIQKNNPGHKIIWRRHVYKVGDPIIFKDNYYFSKVFHNNQKGRIIDIKDEKTFIKFTVELNDFIEKDVAESVENVNVRYIEDKTIVEFVVKKPKEDDTDVDIASAYVVPFSVGYAISIHKAQGLQFENIKIIITSFSEDNISHNIFYTAITRAIKSVDIYWTAETENKIINSFFNDNENDEYSLIVKNILIPIGIVPK